MDVVLDKEMPLYPIEIKQILSMAEMKRDRLVIYPKEIQVIIAAEGAFYNSQKLKRFSRTRCCNGAVNQTFLKFVQAAF